jgi:uncharacterized protein YaaW (UPF0174 family)
MENVVPTMSRDKLLALASIVGLHDTNKPDDSTFGHKLAATGSDNDVAFSMLSTDRMVSEILREISTAGGHTLANLARKGKGVEYREIVWDLARQVRAELSPIDTIASAEGKIAAQVLRTLLENLTPEQRAELADNLERIAREHGKSFAAQGGTLAAITAAQLSGFGVYLAASTAVGAITGFLGVTLPFAFYAAMSKVIAVLIGPPAWAALSLAAVYKAGSPNMKKLVPAVLFIAAERNCPDNG